MTEFKNRLLVLLFAVIATIIILAVVGGILKLLMLVSPLLPAYIAITVALIGIIFYVGYFVNWLFIEPFRKGRTR